MSMDEYRCVVIVKNPHRQRNSKHKFTLNLQIIPTWGVADHVCMIQKPRQVEGFQTYIHSHELPNGWKVSYLQSVVAVIFHDRESGSWTSIYILDRSWKDIWESLVVHFLAQAEAFVQAFLSVPWLSSNSSVSSYDVCMYVWDIHTYTKASFPETYIHTSSVSGGDLSEKHTYIHTYMLSSGF